MTEFETENHTVTSSVKLKKKKYCNFFFINTV